MCYACLLDPVLRKGPEVDNALETYLTYVTIAKGKNSAHKVQGCEPMVQHKRSAQHTQDANMYFLSSHYRTVVYAHMSVLRTYIYFVVRVEHLMSCLIIMEPSQPLGTVQHISLLMRVLRHSSN